MRKNTITLELALEDLWFIYHNLPEGDDFTKMIYGKIKELQDSEEGE